MSTFNEYLRTLLQDKHLSVAALSRLSGIERTAIQKALSGQRVLPYDTLAQLSYCLRLTHRNISDCIITTVLFLTAKVFAVPAKSLTNCSRNYPLLTLPHRHLKKRICYYHWLNTPVTKQSLWVTPISNHCCGSSWQKN